MSGIRLKPRFKYVVDDDGMASAPVLANDQEALSFRGDTARRNRLAKSPAYFAMLDAAIARARKRAL